MTLWRDSMSKIEVTTETAAPSVAIHVEEYDDQGRENTTLLDLHAPAPLITPSGQMRKVKSFSDTHKIRDVTSASGAASARCLRPYDQVTPYPEGSENGTNNYAPSVRSLASIGMGCTDGRKMVIRRVPTSPTELFHLVRPPTWVPPRMIHPLNCYYSIDFYQLYVSPHPRCMSCYNNAWLIISNVCKYTSKYRYPYVQYFFNFWHNLTYNNIGFYSIFLSSL